MDLTEVRAELEAAKAEGRAANLIDANLVDAYLRMSKLRSANMSGANLHGADLRVSDLREANLSGANLRYANLSGVDLTGADLSEVTMYGANLRDANLSGVNLTGADLYGANFYGAALGGAVLNIKGHPSGEAELVATPNGWQLSQGCWGPDTVGTYRAMVEGDDWPQSRDGEQDRRRPSLLAIADLCDAHTEMYPDLIDELATKWGTTTTEPSKMVDMKEVWE